MRNKVEYEWCYETIDKHGDVIDSDCENRLQDFQDNRKTKTLCLVRNEGNQDDGLQDRLWAYIKDGKLPECFSNELGYEMLEMKVPQRFQKEFDKYYRVSTKSPQ